MMTGASFPPNKRDIHLEVRINSIYGMSKMGGN